MARRTGEKIGWTAGWLGGFIWVAILSVILIVHRQWVEGVVGLALVGVAVVAIIAFAPWRRRATPYWKLMIAPYVVLFGSAVWAVWAYGGIENAGLDWWNISWVLPLLIPLGTAGRRKWTDSDSR
jgi:hypothetical protein